MKKLIFLGGSTDKKLGNWRTKYLKDVDLNKLYNLFNPVVRNWTEEAKQKENKLREEADIVFFTINGNNLYSIAELVDCSNKRPGSTIIVFDMDKIKEMKSLRIKSVYAIKEMVEKNGAKIIIKGEFVND